MYFPAQAVQPNKVLHAAGANALPAANAAAVAGAHLGAGAGDLDEPRRPLVQPLNDKAVLASVVRMANAAQRHHQAPAPSPGIKMEPVKGGTKSVGGVIIENHAGLQKPKTVNGTLDVKLGSSESGRENIF